jgi:hypothetical protein
MLKDVVSRHLIDQLASAAAAIQETNRHGARHVHSRQRGLQSAVWMPAVSQRQLAVGFHMSTRLNSMLLLQVYAWAGWRACQLHQGPRLAGTSSKDTGCTGRAGADQRRRSFTMAIMIPHVELQVQHRKRTGGVVQMLGVYTVLSSIGKAAPPTGALAANTEQACKQLKYGCVV